MRVNIQIQSGPKNGHRFILQSGEHLKFDCAERADGVFQDDDQMSAVHFKLQTDQIACYVEDLVSSNYDWWSEEVAAQMSTVLCPASQIEDWLQLLNDGRESDALIGVFSPGEPDKLLSHLRELGRGSTTAADDSHQSQQLNLLAVSFEKIG